MRILFVTDNFPPEVNAPATRTIEHCREWVKAGAEVTVITCAPNFPTGKVFEGYKNRLISKEIVEGIKVIRVWSYMTSNQGLVKRTIDYVSFAVSAFIASLFVKTDLIVATSPQFFTAMSGRWMSIFKMKPWVMEVRDLWPESIRTVGAMKQGIAFRYFKSVEKRLYKSASKIVPVTDSFKDYIGSMGIDPKKISVVKNGANLDLYRNQERDQDLYKELELEGKFVVGYIGTHGLAHKLEFILDCANELKEQPIHFVFVGDGAKKANLLKQNKALKLSNTTFIDPVPKSKVWRYISILDAVIVPLRNTPLFRTVIPSKIFESAAMTKPILLGVDGEARALIEEYEAGLYFEPENKSAFISTLLRLKSDATLYDELTKGCLGLAKDFNRITLAEKMLSELKQAHSSKKSTQHQSDKTLNMGEKV